MPMSLPLADSLLFIGRNNTKIRWKGLGTEVMKRGFVVSVLLGLCCGLIAQFIWKLIYFPEPLIPVIIEVSGIIILTGIAIYCTK